MRPRDADARLTTRSARTPEPAWPPVSYWAKIGAALLAVFAIARVLVAVGDVLVLILVSFVLAIGLQPAVLWLVKRGLPRGAAVAAIAVAAIVVIGGFLALIVPTIVGQVGELIDKAPEYLEQAEEDSGLVGDLNERFELQSKLQDLGESAPSTVLALVRSLTSFVFNTVTVLILTLYFATAMPAVQERIATLLRRAHRRQFRAIIEESTERVGGYLMGNVVISLIAATVTFAFLLVAGIPYPAALAFWVGLADLIPTVGAILGALAIVTVAAFAGTPQLIAAIVFAAVYQQVENYVIAPRVMRRAIEMSAATVIVAVLIGGTLAGFVGALLALPVAAILKISLRELYIERRLEDIEADESEADGTPRAKPRAKKPPAARPAKTTTRSRKSSG